MAELVGTDGPETIVPQEPGTVIPNDKLSYYAQMMNMLQNYGRSVDAKQEALRQRYQDMPFSHMLGESLASSVPVAMSALRPSVRLAPRPTGTGNLLQVDGRFQRAGTPVNARGTPAWPLPATAAAAALTGNEGPSPGVAMPVRPPIAEDSSPVRVPPPEEASFGKRYEPPVEDFGKMYSPPAGTAQGSSKAAPAKRAPQKQREPTLLEKITAALAGQGGSTPKRNVPPSGHYQFGGRPPVGQDAEVGEGGPEAFVPDTDARWTAAPRFDRGNVGAAWGRPAIDRQDNGGVATPSLQSMLGGAGGGFGGLSGLLASALGGKLPWGQAGGANTPAWNMLGLKGFEEGGRPEPDKAAVVGEGGTVGEPKPEAFVPDDELHSMLLEATQAPTSPAAQPRMHKGREVADYSKRDPNAEVAQSKQRWSDIYADPSIVLDQLGTTGQIIGAAIKNAGPTRAEAAPLAGKKEAKPLTPMDHVRQEQKMLIEKGFLPPVSKDGKPSDDGAEGPETIAARKKYHESLASEKSRIEQEIEQGKVRAQEGANIAAQQTAKAQEALAKAQLKKIELEQEEAERKAKQREEGETRIKELDKNLSPTSRFIRDYSGPAGIAAGGLLGALSRFGLKGVSDKFAKSRAASGEATMAEDVAKGAPGTPQRVARVNEFSRKGGGEVPFLLEAEKAPGFSVNPKATPLSKTYDPNIHPVAEVATAAVPGAEAYWAHVKEGEATQELAKAMEAVNADPSEVNIQRMQTAKDNVALYKGLGNMGRVAGGVNVLGGVANRFLPSNPALRPNMAPAEKEQMALQKLLRDSQERAAKAAAKTEAARVPVPNPSLQEMTAPVPAIKAHVPKRQRKAAPESE